MLHHSHIPISATVFGKVLACAHTCSQCNVRVHEHVHVHMCRTPPRLELVSPPLFTGVPLVAASGRTDSKIDCTETLHDTFDPLSCLEGQAYRCRGSKVSRSVWMYGEAPIYRPLHRLPYRIPFDRLNSLDMDFYVTRDNDTWNDICDHFKLDKQYRPAFYQWLRHHHGYGHRKVDGMPHIKVVNPYGGSKKTQHFEVGVPFPAPVGGEWDDLCLGAKLFVKLGALVAVRPTVPVVLILIQKIINSTWRLLIY